MSLYEIFKRRVKTRASAEGQPFRRIVVYKVKCEVDYRSNIETDIVTKSEATIKILSQGCSKIYFVYTKSEIVRENPHTKLWKILDSTNTYFFDRDVNWRRDTALEENIYAL